MNTDEAEERYDLLEHKLRDAIAGGADRSKLVGPAGELCDAGKAWTKTAYEEFFMLRDRYGEADRRTIEAEIHAETAEAVTGLWADLQSALAGKQPPVRSSVLQKCVVAARGVVENSLSPQDGAGKIWTLLAEEGRPYPDELVGFVALASELQDSDEHRAAYEEDVRTAAGELVRKYG